MNRLLHIFPFLFIVSNAFASEEAIKNHNSKNYFFGIKGGIIFPTPMYGSTGLKTGENTYAWGPVLGRNFGNIISLDLEYSDRANNFNEQTLPGEVDNPSYWHIKSETYTANITLS